MTKRPAFQFYPSDFLVGTAILTPEETGIYIRLLCYQWTNGGLINCVPILARLAACEDEGAVAAVMSLKFEEGEDGKLYNKRLEEVRQEQEQYREKQRENAKKRWAVDAVAMPPHKSGIEVASNRHIPKPCSSSSPSTSNTSSKEEVGVEFPANLKSADFGSAWEGYLAYRKSSRLKSLAPASVQAQLRNLSEMGHDAAIEAINQSIANGWQGIFPPKLKKPAPVKAKEVDLSW
jgi:uncharacterized protein YdaU (DUF1376 family)